MELSNATSLTFISLWFWRLFNSFLAKFKANPVVALSGCILKLMNCIKPASYTQKKNKWGIRVSLKKKLFSDQNSSVLPGRPDERPEPLSRLDVVLLTRRSQGVAWKEKWKMERFEWRFNHHFFFLLTTFLEWRKERRLIAFSHFYCSFPLPFNSIWLEWRGKPIPT